MAVLALAIVLINLCAGAAAGQTTQRPSFSLGSLLQIPRHCLINLLSCKETCKECGTCYEKFLDCVTDFKAEETSNSTFADAQNFQDTERTFDDDATETDIEIPGVCVGTYQECMKGNCTECILCYNILIDCVDRNSLTQDSNEPDDIAGPMYDEPQYPGYLGYPGSPFQYGDFMEYSQYPGSEGAWFPTQAEQRSSFPFLDQLANYMDQRQFQFLHTKFGIPIPQVEASTHPSVETSTPSSDTSTPPSDNVNPTTEGQVTPTTDPPVLYQECLTKFTKCLVNCADCTSCIPEIQKCSVAAYRPRIKGNLP